MISWKLALTIAVGILLVPVLLIGLQLLILAVIGSGVGSRWLFFRGAEKLNAWNPRERIRSLFQSAKAVPDPVKCIWFLGAVFLFFSVVAERGNGGIVLLAVSLFGLGLLWVGVVKALEDQEQKAMIEGQREKRRLLGKCPNCSGLYTFGGNETGTKRTCPHCGNTMVAAVVSGPA